jgi:hypothetical protein
MPAGVSSGPQERALNRQLAGVRVAEQADTTQLTMDIRD